MLFYVHGFKKTVYLIYALLSRIKFCRDYALFKGHFWPKFDGRGHGNILKDREVGFFKNSRNTIGMVYFRKALRTSTSKMMIPGVKFKIVKN